MKLHLERITPEFVLATVISALIFTVLLVGILVLTDYAHEGGHMLFGFIGGLGEGKIASFGITAWQNIEGIPTPQQTTIFNATPGALFRFGGIILVVFGAWTVLQFLGSKYRLNKTGLYCIIFAILNQEIVGNLVCGTDNWLANPLPICSQIIRDIYMLPTFFLLIIGLALIFPTSWTKRISKALIEIGLQFKKKLHRGYEFT